MTGRIGLPEKCDNSLDLYSLLCDIFIGQCDVSRYFFERITSRMSNLPGSMTGLHYVRAVRSAFQDAQRLFPNMCDRAELRRQALKMRFFGEDSSFPDMAVDLNWSWVESLRKYRIGELRIDDEIGGFNNLRIITWHPIRSVPPSWAPNQSPVSHIWVLAVMQKKNNDFTKANLSTFKLRRVTVLERFYDGET